MMICGRNTMTLPTPEITPFCRKLCSKPRGQGVVNQLAEGAERRPTAAPSAAAPRRTPPGTSRTGSAPGSRAPPPGCSTTASIRAVQVSGLVGRLTVAAMMRSASRWVARNCATVSGCHEFGCTARGASAAMISSVRRSSSAVPPLRTAIEVTTGTPSVSRQTSGTSTVTPRRVAMSNMLSTSISGRPVRLELEHEADRQPQIGGIGDAEHEVGQRLAGGAAEHDVAGDFLVRAAAAQRIGAGQIDQR